MNRRRRASLRALLVALAAIGLASSCRSSAREVVAYTSVDQPFAEPIFKLSEGSTGAREQAVFDTEETKSTGVVNRLTAERDHPQADVFWSGDPVRIFLMIKRDLVEPYLYPNAAAIPPGFRAADDTWTGFAARARILLVNKNWVPAGEMPRSIRDLANGRWRDQTAIANLLFGTTTMHVAALFAAWGEEQAKRFLDDLKASGARIARSNGEVKRRVA